MPDVACVSVEASPWAEYKARALRRTTYGEQTVYDDQPVQLLDGPADGPEFLAYGSTPSMAKRDYFLPEDIPLFLSNEPDEPRQRRFGSGGDSDFHRAAARSRFIKAGLLAVSAAAIAAAILSVENPLALFANAKASLIGVQANAIATIGSRACRLRRPSGHRSARRRPLMPSVGRPRRLAGSPHRPRRRAMKSLSPCKAAHQSQPEIRPPAAAAAAPPPHPPVRRLAADELATLLKRANGPDRDRRYRVCPIAARTRRGRAGGRRRAACWPKPTTRPCWERRMREASLPIRRRRVTGTRRRPGSVRRMRSSASVKYRTRLYDIRGHHATLTWNGDVRHDDGLWLRGAGRGYRV